MLVMKMWIFSTFRYGNFFDNEKICKNNILRTSFFFPLRKKYAIRCRHEKAPQTMLEQKENLINHMCWTRFPVKTKVRAPQYSLGSPSRILLQIVSACIFIHAKRPESFKRTLHVDLRDSMVVHSMEGGSVHLKETLCCAWRKGFEKLNVT